MNFLVKDGALYSIAQLKADNPQVSFPAEIEGVDLSDYGCTWAEQPPESALAAMEAGLLARIDRDAGQFRRRFITDVPGQAETYLQKRQEAEAFALDSNGVYPMLQAEAAARGISMAELAAEVTAIAGAWHQLGAAIEGARMGAKQSVRNAETWEAKQAAAQIDWQTLVPG